MQIRARKMGFVFQDFNLVPTRTALENVMLAGEYAGLHGSANRKAALDALDLVGLGQAPGWRVRPGSTQPRTHAREGPAGWPGGAFVIPRRRWLGRIWAQAAIATLRRQCGAMSARVTPDSKASPIGGRRDRLRSGCSPDRPLSGSGACPPRRINGAAGAPPASRPRSPCREVSSGRCRPTKRARSCRSSSPGRARR